MTDEADEEPRIISVEDDALVRAFPFEALKVEAQQAIDEATQWRLDSERRDMPIEEICDLEEVAEKLLAELTHTHDILREYGAYHRAARKAVGVTMGDLANHLMCPVARISDIERGRAVMHFAEYVRILEFLETKRREKETK